MDKKSSIKKFNSESLWNVYVTRRGRLCSEFSNGMLWSALNEASTAMPGLKDSFKNNFIRINFMKLHKMPYLNNILPILKLLIHYYLKILHHEVCTQYGIGANAVVAVPQRGVVRTQSQIRQWRCAEQQSVKLFHPLKNTRTS